MSKRFLLMLALLGWFSAPALADPEDCMMCHGADEFEGVAPEAVQEALADPGLPPHSRFADMTIEEVKALLEALAK
jgi:hypothetical protein